MSLLHTPPRAAVLLWVLGFVAMLAPCAISAQQLYPTAEAAADAFVEAIATSDNVALRNVLGADWKRFIRTDDIHRDDLTTFLGAWAKSHRVESTADRAHLVVGEQDWVLPIPIAKHGDKWRFDPQAGADEMRTRRIGRNELAAMQAALAYFDAQKEYASTDRMGDGVLQYAQKFRSTPGKRDGLYWPVDADEPPSPLGTLFADVRSGEGYYGYRYKILKAQGPHAPGGAYSYLIQGRMVSGFALVAWPVRYGDTGVMTFMLSHDGRLYQKNLGKNSATLASGVPTFDPDKTWESVNETGLVKNTR